MIFAYEDTCLTKVGQVSFLCSVVLGSLNKKAFAWQRLFVGETGFEPATFWSQTRRANRAALHPEDGAKIHLIFELWDAKIELIVEILKNVHPLAVRRGTIDRESERVGCVCIATAIVHKERFSWVDATLFDHSLKDSR